jgi:hypothetical protein
MPGTSTAMVQLIHPGFGRRVALVDGGELQLLGTYRSVYAFAQAALDTGYRLRDLLSTDLTGIALDYDKVWGLETEWRFLPSFDHPEELARCIVSGAGFTDETGPVDFPDGPAWFLKGNGAALRGHGDALTRPEFAVSASESAEIAATYIIDTAGVPRRIGLTAGNQFCDPAQAAWGVAGYGHSKLRPCSIGPELRLDAGFEEIRGRVSIRRGGAELWSAGLATGDRRSRFTLERLETSLFRHDGHRRPGDAHVYFLGSSETSHGAGVRLEEGDETIVGWEGFGPPLINRAHTGGTRPEAKGESRAAAIPL